MKAERNKTIDITVEEGRKYFEKCISLNSVCNIDDITNKTICGDTFETIKYLPNNFIDLLIVDPPYNLDKQFGESHFSKMSDEDYINYTQIWIEAILPKLKNTSSIYVCCDWETSILIGTVLKKYFIIQNRITWQREKGRGALSNWKNGMEDIWFCTKTKQFTFNVNDVKIRRKVIAPYKVDGKPKDWMETMDGNFRDTFPSNFWDDISIPYWSMLENTAHPTQKPEKLLAKIILASSNCGDFIFDPFLGSGSSSVTAKKLGRKYCGIEKNEQYCVWAEKRLEMADTDKTIQGYADNIFWERNTGALQKKVVKK